jgi:CPA1 family monovalent cation:H+ antiporter
VLFWSGIRGAIAVALALSLPTGFPDRELLQGIVFGVVLFTLLVQGASAGLVVRRFAAAPVARSDQEPRQIS